MSGGAHPNDAKLFAEQAEERLRLATQDLSWLLTRGYPQASALTLVGNRYALVTRQREAVARMSASEQQVRQRERSRVRALEPTHLEVAIDAFNVIVGVENILRGGVVLIGLDGAFRDMASVHGSYRGSPHTHEALALISTWFATRSSQHDLAVNWYVDAPVSNSGRLAQWIRDVAPARADTSWRVDVVPDADHNVSATSGVAASADASILDRAPAWIDLVACVAGDRATWLIAPQGTALYPCSRSHRPSGR